jgi:hypothetical protein
MRGRIAFLALLCLVLAGLPAASPGRSTTGGGSSGRSSGGSHSGSTWVSTYARKDGTVIQGHWRRGPGSVPSITLHTSTRWGALSTTPHYASGYVGARDEHGRILRSEAQKHAFERQTGYPHGRPGYVVDHIVPLKRGGCDCPENMQWQTVAEAKAKDKWE